MQDFRGKVAVVTGAASGIGRALADRCALEGMGVVLADIEAAALLQAETELKASGAAVLAVRADVSKAEEVKELAEQTIATFGAAHLLFNNAGVGGNATVWESSLDDWEWIIGVNLMGVIHGLHFFVPRMLAQQTPCHIVNTASVAGLVSSPGLGNYKVTKHGVVTLSETLHHELTERKAQIGVSVLCPGFVNTRIVDADRNRPGERDTEYAADPQIQAIRQAVAGGMEPAQVAAQTFQAIVENRFYILTHPEFKPVIRLRMDDILQERSPTNPRLLQ